MRFFPAFLWLIVAAPGILLIAQGQQQAPPASDNATQLPAGGSPPGPQESLEGGPGIAFGLAVLVGMVAVIGVLGMLSWRYSHRER